jgi:hypothetical protein
MRDTARTGTADGRRSAAAWRLSSPALALVAVAVGGCAGPAPRTQVMVLVDADPGVRDEVERLRVSVRGGRGESMGGLDAPKSSEFVRGAGAGDVGLEWPTLVAVVPLDGDAGRVFEVEAEAIDVARRAVALVRARTGFAPGRTLVLRLRLSDTCRGVLCRAGQTCEAGSCRDVAMQAPGTLAPFDPGNVRPIDAGVDMPPVGCARDEECDDRVFCNGVERCVEGTCRAGERVVCDDGVACTRDVCRGDGCVAENDDGACTDAPGGRCAGPLGCQYGRCEVGVTCVPSTGCEEVRCDGSTCVRTSRCGAGQTCCGAACVPVGCDDGNPCTADVCDGTACVYRPRSGSSCSDGDACTTGDACTAAGRCVGTPLPCDDGNPCTDDACNPSLGCVRTNNAAPCSDGNPCTTGDVCRGGVCVAGTACNDGVACTADSCGPTGCVFTPMNALCTAMPGGTCDRATGCQYPSCTAATCAPANACETARCDGPTCVRTPVVCMDDGNPCTTELCDPAAGCVTVANTLPCDDGNRCTLTDVCEAGRCVGRNPDPCNDGNPCTGAACDPVRGCTHPITAGAPCGPTTGCSRLECDGAGACITVNDPCTGPGDAQCVSYECLPGVGCQAMATDAPQCCVGGRSGVCNADYLCEISGGFDCT